MLDKSNVVIKDFNESHYELFSSDRNMLPFEMLPNGLVAVIEGVVAACVFVHLSENSPVAFADHILTNPKATAHNRVNGMKILMKEPITFSQANGRVILRIHSDNPTITRFLNERGGFSKEDRMCSQLFKVV